MHGHSKLAARKSPSPDNRERKRPRLFKSPQPGSPSRNVIPSPKTPEVKQAHEAREASMGIFRTPPTPVDVQYQPAGPSPDADKLLGYSPSPVDTMRRPPSPPLLPRMFIAPEGSQRAVVRESVEQRPAFNMTEAPFASAYDPLALHGRVNVLPATTSQPIQPSQARQEPRTPTPTPRQRQSPYETPWKKLTVTTVDFEELSAHTAKCDLCDRRNTEGMWRCTPCGWQCCRRCLIDRGGDRSHPKAGTIHCPRDMLPMSSLMTPKEGPSGTAASTSRRRVRASRASRGTRNVSTDEQAARLLSTMREDYQDRRRQLPPPAAKESNDAAAPQRPAGTDGEMAGHGEMGVNGAQGLQDFTMDVDLDNLPDHLVNVRRNPSRRARPADLKE
ncbi:Uncharacterized protein PECH_004170 [Penicillium ucsense]|uniref:Uncharacterized protein n=1 Tax=Penicillium ucsense TaxID=2839758 RepID=A0A8J8W7S5_9EURO|nr:Uncharacterized protein PECM_005577 [Penicillium ucsense]KAF7737252.1 Uncharacterized protein PECH_004170 [Penicillium ucsense]